MAVDLPEVLWNACGIMSANVQDLPGYRRRLRVEPRKRAVLAMLEDDIHAMAVTLRHDGVIVTAVESDMHRWPWTTCPGARAQLAQTFVGQPLTDVTSRREKRANCTHLHDLAVLAAAHAADKRGFVVDILVSDPIAGQRILELRRKGVVVLHWIEQDGILMAPPAVAGQSLLTMRDCINAMDQDDQEAARLLQWGAIVGHGRTLPMARQSVATDMPASCYTFQPERAVMAKRIGRIEDFSDRPQDPLASFAEDEIARLDSR